METATCGQFIGRPQTFVELQYLDPTNLEKNGYFVQQMAFLTNSDASLTERLKFPRSRKKIVKLSKRKHLSLNNM